MGTSGVVNAFLGNLIFLGGRWYELFTTVRFPKVLAMMVLGLWSVRHGIALDPGQYRPLLRRWCAIGFVVGLPANLLASWAESQWGYTARTGAGDLGRNASRIRRFLDDLSG